MSSETLVTLFLPSALMVIMFGMGLGLEVDDFRRVAERPRPILIGLVGQLVLLPLVGFAVAWAFALPPPLAVGTVLLCACPGGPTSNLFTKLGAGDVALSVSLTAMSGLVTVVTIPLVTNLGISLFGGAGASVHLPVLATIAKVALVTVVPVVAGMILRRRLRQRAHAVLRLERHLTRVSVLLLVVIIAGAVAKEGPRVAASVARVGVPMVLLSVAGMAAGSLLARAARLSSREALTIAIEVGMQNGALAIALALSMPDGSAVAVPAVVYGLWAYAPCALAAAWGKRRHTAPGA